MNKKNDETEDLPQDITFAQNRMSAKIAALPKLESSDLPEHMKQSYRDGIAHEQSLIAKFQAKLARS